ncbi:transcriptional coactivator YAP1-like isoform X2 [Argonauta hians]
MSQQRTEQKGNQVVHVRGDSDSDLEALFKAAMNPAEVPHQVPLRMRNLPASFFTPPDPTQQKQHSREGSTDSTGAGSGSVLTIAHPRAHSSPASLTQTLSAAPPPSSQHVRQHSYDLTDEQPLPPGWEMAKTNQGHRYYLNHLDQSTTWHDPRKSHNTVLNNQPQNRPQSQQSPPVSLQTLGPLPPGWEQASTNEGEVYFINHVERTTSWYDPRITLHMQQQQPVQGVRVQNPGQSPQSLKLSPGPQPQQQSPGGPPQVVNSNGNNQVNQGQRVMAPSIQQLQNLALEKEQLKKRAEEITRQELLLRAQIHPESEMPIPQTSEMTSVADPFLGHTTTQADLHSRQESSDSGLGGMGTNYNLKSSEDFLSNVDEMDTQDGGHKMQSPGDFGNMDIGNVGDSGENTNMDSDDLVPSLQEDITTELLNDVENVLNNSKVDGLLWL